jgi:epoxyqueuosine reductase
MKPGVAAQLTTGLKEAARALGFELTGACPAISPNGATRLGEWLGRGYAGEMNYIADRRVAYEHPRHVLDGVQSILMLGLPYRTEEPRRAGQGQGRISRYAWGPDDYHDLIHQKLRRLIGAVNDIAPGARARGVVDTAPLLEREFAQLAGLGWIGKHTLLINKPAGSYFFLAALLIDQPLVYDEPFAADHCGTCRACLDACPTQAFPQPGVLDATRCISYLTIELRGPIPIDLRAGVGDWVFGCDVCQDVCPWNQHAIAGGSGSPRDAAPGDFQPREGANPVDLLALFALDDEGFRRRYRHTPLWRAKRRGILRNAAIVLGNQRDRSATPVLAKALADAEPLVRGASAWALGRIGDASAVAVLNERKQVERDEVVRREIEEAVKSLADASD